MGQEEALSSWKTLKLVLEKATCGTKDKGQKLQGGRAHACHVEVICDLCKNTTGKKGGTSCTWAELTVSSCCRSIKNGRKTGGQILARLRQKAHNVHCQHGHQDRRDAKGGVEAPTFWLSICHGTWKRSGRSNRWRSRLTDVKVEAIR